jgi:hypothetical protein
MRSCGGKKLIMLKAVVMKQLRYGLQVHNCTGTRTQSMISSWQSHHLPLVAMWQLDPPYWHFNAYSQRQNVRESSAHLSTANGELLDVLYPQAYRWPHCSVLFTDGITNELLICYVTCPRLQLMIERKLRGDWILVMLATIRFRAFCLLVCCQKT